MRRNNLPTTPLAAHAVVFVLLVLIGVAGRWGQAAWACTPVAAVTLLAGACFTRAWVAMLVPFSALLITDLGLASHSNLPVMLTVYASMMAPALLGRWLRREHTSSSLAWAGRIGVASLAPATLFYLTTNLAVWCFQSYYPSTLSGLASCYANAVPFYRNMLAGDIVYTALLFTAAAVAGQGVFGKKQSPLVTAPAYTPRTEKAEHVS